jgi:hypothetical protein
MAALVMKDIVVNEIQKGLVEEAGADCVSLIASVLGPALHNLLDLATLIGLETIVECHTQNEEAQALEALAPQQAVQLAGMFPGLGGHITSIVGGGIEEPEYMKHHLAV